MCECDDLARGWGVGCGKVLLEGENPGAVVSWVLCQPTELGSERGIGSPSFSGGSGWSLY